MKNLKLFEAFVDSINEGVVKMTQDEFNKLHDKFYHEGVKIAKTQKNTPEFKDEREWQDSNQGVFHNRGVNHMLIKMGEVFGIKKSAKAEDDTDYAYEVEENPKFTKFFNLYSSTK